MLKISLRPSRLLAGVLILSHGAAIAVVMLVAIPLWVKFVATAVLLVHVPFIVGRHALLFARHAAVAIEIGPDRGVSVQMRTGEWVPYEVLGSTYVMPCLTVLNLRRDGSRAHRRITLLPDSLEAEDFRRLRVWLRWKKDNAQS